MVARMKNPLERAKAMEAVAKYQPNEEILAITPVFKNGEPVNTPGQPSRNFVGAGPLSDRFVFNSERPLCQKVYNVLMPDDLIKVYWWNGQIHHSPGELLTCMLELLDNYSNLHALKRLTDDPYAILQFSDEEELRLYCQSSSSPPLQFKHYAPFCCSLDDTSMSILPWVSSYYATLLARLAKRDARIRQFNNPSPSSSKRKVQSGPMAGNASMPSLRASAAAAGSGLGRTLGPHQSHSSGAAGAAAASSSASSEPAQKKARVGVSMSTSTGSGPSGPKLNMSAAASGPGSRGIPVAAEQNRAPVAGVRGHHGGIPRPLTEADRWNRQMIQEASMSH